MSCGVGIKYCVTGTVTVSVIGCVLFVALSVDLLQCAQDQVITTITRNLGMVYITHKYHISKKYCRRKISLLSESCKSFTSKIRCFIEVRVYYIKGEESVLLCNSLYKCILQSISVFHCFIS